MTRDKSTVSVSRKKILLLGSGGLLGRYLVSGLTNRNFDVRALSRMDLEIRDAEKSVRILTDFQPDLVVNAAALCRMEDCEKNPDYSLAVNARAPAWWAAASAERRIFFVHLSTDYVFGGGRKTPYTELDQPEPLSVYARHKREGEEAVLAHPDHVVLRLAWVFGRDGATFMSRIPQLLAEQETLRVATGRTGSCLYAGYGAGVIADFLEKKFQEHPGARGLFHLTHRGEVTWPDFAAECKRQMLERGMKVRNREIRKAPPGAHEALSARRPDYSVLDVGKLESLLGHGMTDWRSGLESYLEEMGEGLKL